jgi:hypothetical protein
VDASETLALRPGRLNLKPGLSDDLSNDLSDEALAKSEALAKLEA